MSLDRKRYCQTPKHFNVWTLEYNPAKRRSEPLPPTIPTITPSPNHEPSTIPSSSVESPTIPTTLSNPSPSLNVEPPTIPAIPSNHTLTSKSTIRSILSDLEPPMIPSSNLQSRNQDSDTSRDEPEDATNTTPQRDSDDEDTSKHILRDITEAKVIQCSRARKRTNFVLKMPGIDDESFCYSTFVGATLLQTQNRRRLHRSDLSPPKTWNSFTYKLDEHAERWRNTGPNWTLIAS